MEKGWNDGEAIVVAALEGVRGETRWPDHWHGSVQVAATVSPHSGLRLKRRTPTRTPERWSGSVLDPPATPTVPKSILIH